MIFIDFERVGVKVLSERWSERELNPQREDLQSSALRARASPHKVLQGSVSAPAKALLAGLSYFAHRTRKFLR